MEEEYDDALKKYEECKKEVEKRKAKRLYFESVKATLDHLGEAVAEFDERLWCNLLDHIVVNDEERVTVIFRDGMEIVVPLGDLVKSRTRTASRKNDLVKRAVALFEWLGRQIYRAKVKPLSIAKIRRFSGWQGIFSRFYLL